METKFSYKGYEYQPWLDYEEDNVKRFHDVKTPEGKSIYAELSSYEEFTEETFQKWIDLGMPGRRYHPRGSFPLRNEDILELWEINSRRFIYD
jgi:hypothetical protein